MKKMNTADYIINQLISQNIDFKLLQNINDSNPTSLVSITVSKWKAKFINDKIAPGLDSYLWHIFSFGSAKSIKGTDATIEYLSQPPTNVLIFNESQQFLIECSNSIPNIAMDDFTDDIYISHHNMKWTYVLPHEIPDFGPYFSKQL